MKSSIRKKRTRPAPTPPRQILPKDATSESDTLSFERRLVNRMARLVGHAIVKTRENAECTEHLLITITMDWLRISGNYHGPFSMKSEAVGEHAIQAVAMRNIPNWRNIAVARQGLSFKHWTTIPIEEGMLVSSTDRPIEGSFLDLMRLVQTEKPAYVRKTQGNARMCIYVPSVAAGGLAYVVMTNDFM